MARDRQRAKQRRARQQRSGGKQSPEPAGTPRAEDPAEPTEATRSASRQDEPLEAERRPTTEPPEPTEEASGAAELAKEAIEGAPVDEADPPPAGSRGSKAGVYEDELTDEGGGGGVLSELVDRDADLGIEDEPDPELEREAEAAGAALGRPSSERGAAAARPEGNRVMAFLRACWAELQRVQWPDRRQVAQATAVVLGFVVITGAYLGGWDFVWSKVVNALLDL